MHHVVTVTHLADETGVPFEEPLTVGYMQVYSGGLSIISSTTSITPGIGYTETHTLKFIAYDAAGNKTESGISTFSVIHDPEVIEEQNQPEAALLPDVGRRRWGL